MQLNNSLQACKHNWSEEQRTDTRRTHGEPSAAQREMSKNTPGDSQQRARGRSTQVLPFTECCSCQSIQTALRSSAGTGNVAAVCQQLLVCVCVCVGPPSGAGWCSAGTGLVLCPHRCCLSPSVHLCWLSPGTGLYCLCTPPADPPTASDGQSERRAAVRSSETRTPFRAVGIYIFTQTLIKLTSKIVPRLTSGIERQLLWPPWGLDFCCD